MWKIKRMIMGMMLSACVFMGNVGSCYAVSSNITVDVTASRVTGKFVYGEAGHQIKVTAYFQEIHSSGFTRNGSASDTQFGNVTTAYVSRNSSDGYRYVWAYSEGWVDGKKDAISATVYS